VTKIKNVKKRFYIYGPHRLLTVHHNIDANVQHKIKRRFLLRRSRSSRNSKNHLLVSSKAVKFLCVLHIVQKRLKTNRDAFWGRLTWAQKPLLDGGPDPTAERAPYGDMCQNENVPKIIINDTISLFLETAISILVISNHNSFRVLFDKNCFVIFYLKKYNFIFQHWKWSAQGTSTVPIVSAHFRSLLGRRLSRPVRASRVRHWLPSPRGDWKCETWKYGTVKNAGVENARHENAAPICKGGKCGKS